MTQVEKDETKRNRTENGTQNHMRVFSNYTFFNNYS